MSRFNNLAKPYINHVSVAVAGTPEQGTDLALPPGVKIFVRAHPSNTGTLYLGASSADALSTSSAHVPLLANQSQSFLLTNLKALWFNVSVSGEKAIVTFER